jgi:DNA-binding LytR/AlgR family response regulator
MQNFAMQVFVYHSGEDFLKAVDSGMAFHIVFMDIEMETMNGIAAGHQFRKNTDSYDVVIIYISSHNTFSDELLDIGNVRYIMKPYCEEKLDMAFDRAYTQATKHMEKTPQNEIFYTVGKDQISVETENLVYLKSTKNLVSLYIWDSGSKSIRYLDKFYSTINEAMIQLPQENFFRCERSHIVNLAYVKQVWGTALVLSDNMTEIPIGKTYRAEVKKAYFRHRGIHYGWPD